MQDEKKQRITWAVVYQDPDFIQCVGTEPTYAEALATAMDFASDLIESHEQEGAPEGTISRICGLEGDTGYRFDVEYCGGTGGTREKGAVYLLVHEEKEP